MMRYLKKGGSRKCDNEFLESLGIELKRNLHWEFFFFFPVKKVNNPAFCLWSPSGFWQRQQLLCTRVTILMLGFQNIVFILFYFFHLFLLTPPFIIKTSQSSSHVESLATHTRIKQGALRRGYCHSFLFEVHSSEGRSWLAAVAPSSKDGQGCRLFSTAVYFLTSSVDLFHRQASGQWGAERQGALGLASRDIFNLQISIYLSHLSPYFTPTPFPSR